MKKNDALKKQRIRAGLSQEELAEKLGVKQSYVAALESSKSFSAKKAKQIAEILGVEWTSIMIFEDEDSKDYTEVIKKNPRLEADPLHLAFDPREEGVPTKFQELADGTLIMHVSIIPIRGYAGYMRGFPDPEYYQGLETLAITVLKQHKGHYLAFEVKGDSMTTLEPEYFRESIFEGSIVVGRELIKTHWQYKLHTHNFDAWVIVHKTEGILIKKIINHDVEKGFITIHSLNPDKETYPDQDLFLDDIEQIFNIVQIVNKR